MSKLPKSSIGALLLSVALITPASAALSAPNHPSIEKRDHASQLFVNGRPFLVLGGEVYNSSSSNRAYMQPIWPKLAAMNLNTVLVPLSWEQIEPKEGVFDFSLMDALITDARKNGLHLGLLWFGSWKNLVSSYAPAWVRSDRHRFPVAKDKAGYAMPMMSTFSKEGEAADGKAFAAVMKHLREVDSKQQTVVLVQVENEVGLQNGDRDHSEAADKAFGQEVPRALIDELVRHKSTLSREMVAAWTAAGAKTSGTWTEVFGSGDATNEIFTAWNYASYISGVVAPGHADYPVPLFVNAAIGRQDGKLASYPSGGSLPLVLDVWHAAAPEIAMLSPDIYYGSFPAWCEKYTQSGNPLLIPETRNDPMAASNAFLAFGNYGAIGFSPFGIDGPANQDLAQAYATLKELSPLLLEAQSKGATKAVLLDTTNAAQRVSVGNYNLNVQLRKDRRSGNVASLGFALIITEGDGRFTIAGKDVQITFATGGAEPATVGLDVVEEGSFVDNKWVPSRRLNGDEVMLDYNFEVLAPNHQDGTGLRFGEGRPQIYRLHVFQIR